MQVNKTREMKHVSFRMLADVHADYVAVAESRGVDLSALLNWVVTACRPTLLLMRAENDAGMLRAATAGLSPQLGPGSQEPLSKLNELIRSLQEVASKLASQVNGRDAQCG